MECHVLSWSGARRRFRPLRRCFVRPCPACRSSIAFRSPPFRSPRRRRPGRAEPFSARIAPACPRASPPARFARLIARARGREPDAGRTSPVRFTAVFRNRCHRPRDAGEAAPDAASPGHISALAFSGQGHFGNYFKKSEQETASGQCRRAPLEAGMKRKVARSKEGARETIGNMVSTRPHGACSPGTHGKSSPRPQGGGGTL